MDERASPQNVLRSNTRASGFFFQPKKADTQGVTPSFSTNSTASNLPGPGRVLGNVYSYTGRRLERIIGVTAHKAGFGPVATYKKITRLCSTNWRGDWSKASLICELCFKLYDYAVKSSVEATVATAIHKLGDIFRSSQDLLLWMAYVDGVRLKTCAEAVCFKIEATPSPRKCYGSAAPILLLHGFGLRLLTVGCTQPSVDRGEINIHWLNEERLSDDEVEKWHESLRGVLSGLRCPAVSRLSVWYLYHCLGAHLHAQLGQQTQASIQTALNNFKMLTISTFDIDNVGLISVLIDYSTSLGDMGRKEEASGANEHLARLCNSLSALDPGTRTIDLSHSLQKTADGLNKLGMRRESIAISYKDVALCRGVANEPGIPTDDLAFSLLSLYFRLRDADRMSEALDAIRECHAVLCPGEYNICLRGTLQSLANCLLDVSESGSLEVIEDCAKIYERLASLSLHEYNINKIKSLGSLKDRYRKSKRINEALDSIRECTTIRKKLVADSPGKCNTDLQLALGKLYGCIQEARSEDIGAIEEYVAFCRILANSSNSMDKYNIDLARSLGLLCHCLQVVGQLAEAITVAEERLAICRKLAASDISREYDNDLARALGKLYDCCRDAGRTSEAEAITQYATIRGEYVVARDPVQLAWSLDKSYGQLWNAGRRTEAAKAIKDCVAIRRNLATRDPVEFVVDLAHSLDKLYDHLRIAGGWVEAFKVIKECVDVRRKLVSYDRYNLKSVTDLAQSLDKLHNHLAYAGKWSEALDTIEECAAIRRELAARDPDKFNDDLESSLDKLHSATSMATSL